MVRLKRTGILLTAFMLVVSVLVAGCTSKQVSTNGGTPSQAGKDQYLTVLVEGGSPAFTVVNETAERFKEQTGYDIKVEAVPYIGVFDKLNAEMKGKSGSYDVATIDILWFSTLAQGLAPMDDLFTDEVKNDLFPNLIDGAVVDGNLLGMPVWTNSKILLYRTDLFEDAAEKEAFKKEFGYELKPPTTWDEYRDIAKFFTRDPDRDGVTDLYGTSVFGMNNGDSVASWLDHAAQAGAGPLVVGEDGKALVHSQPYVEALDFLTRIVREDQSAPEGALNMASSETSELFWNGKLAMMLAWGHFFVPSNDPAKSKVAGNVGAAPMIGGQSGVGVVPGPWYQVIPSSSKKQDIAKEYVKFIYEHNELFMKALGVAARKSVFDQYGKDPAYAHLIALNSTLTAGQTQNRPVLEHWNEIESEALVPAVQAALSGKSTPEEALNQAAALINEIQGQ